MSEPWKIEKGDDPLVATAIHAGHELRGEAAQLMVLAEDERLREEDPFTDLWVGSAGNTVIVNRSRFEFDLNRPRKGAIYREPDDAWGLEVWGSPLPDEVVARSLDLYDRFYADMGDLCDGLLEAHRRFVVLDIHSYNHRRRGPDSPVDDPELNPEVNLGTESIHPAWNDVVGVFADTLVEHPFDHGHLDVRSNVKFKGGRMSRWINERYGPRGCSIAVEFKKFYMDEWTGELNEGTAAVVGAAVAAAAGAVRERLAEDIGST